MPISTPELATGGFYGGDSAHFEHVLQHLFYPAIEAINFEPIAPVAKGSDLIHGEIIKNLEKAEMVLCDMSTLNPNVFFEFGIRTALNLPICLVRDDVPMKVPFDVGAINHHTYLHQLRPWTLASQIQALSAHLQASIDRSEGTNGLWRYFSSG